MKTICTLNGRIIMAQDGDALKAMQANAAQYPGAVACAVSDAEYEAIKAAQPKTTEESNALILAELAKMDQKIIRALVEGDTARITAHKAAQTALRAKLT